MTTKHLITSLKAIGSYKFIGSETAFFTNVASITEADEHSLCWLKPSLGLDKAAQLLASSKAGIVITHTEALSNTFPGKNFVVVENPRLFYARVVKQFFEQKPAHLTSNKATLHPQAEIGKNVHIADNAIIHKAKIGNNVIIHENVVLYDGVEIGDNVEIGAGTVIGCIGFGYNKNEEQHWERFPQIGGVQIGHNVAIGSNCSIDRGTLGNTLIEEGVKIDSQVMIAHNNRIGKHSILCAQVCCSGSITIGSHTWVGPGSTLLNGITIGENAFIGISSVVLNDVKPYTKVFGNPAMKVGKVDA